MGQRNPDEGKLIAKILWPSFLPTEDGGTDDLLGIDGFLYNNPVQVKFNHRIVISGNLYHEIYEKTDKRPEQPWRRSLSNAYYHIFITEKNNEYIGYLVSLDELASCESGLELITISPNNGKATSMGFLIKLSAIPAIVKTQRKS